MSKFVFYCNYNNNKLNTQANKCQRNLAFFDIWRDLDFYSAIVIGGDTIAISLQILFYSKLNARFSRNFHKDLQNRKLFENSGSCHVDSAKFMRDQYHATETALSAAMIDYHTMMNIPKLQIKFE